MGSTPSWYAFAGGLALLGLLMFWSGENAPWIGLALVLGALYAAEREATLRAIPGPLAELGLKAEGR
jgi:hypothetical protein